MAIMLASKAPGERIDYFWTPPLDDGDALTSPVTVTRVSGTAVNESATIQLDNLNVRLWFFGGAHGETTKFTAQVETVGGRIWQETFYLPVYTTADYRLTLGMVKQQLEYEDSDRDELIQQYIRTSTSWVENYTGKLLTRRLVTQTFDRFGDYLQLINGPVVSVSDITYNGNVALTGYRLRGTRVLPPPGGWPTLEEFGEITVTYLAGYDEPPAEIISAQLLLIAHWFQNREAATERPAQEIALAVEALLSNYRHVGL